MNVATGVDLIEIERVAAAIKRHGARFLARIYTSRELDDCQGRVESLAVRFAAKEAVAKALGCGIGDISWRDIEIQRAENGQPVLQLMGAAEKLAQGKKFGAWSVSLSHSGAYAIATVVLLG
ncbi:MAG: holo-ACP synthase [Anaerolineales bacterium]|nr:holo-ACP synthase [Anaerolineales bacterium]